MGLAVRERNEKQSQIRSKQIKVINDVNNFNEMNRNIKKSNLKKFLIFSTLGSIIIVMTMLVLMRYTKITELNSQVKVLNKEVEELKTKRDYLIIQLEPYKATARIETLAKINLGMDYPKSQQHVKIESGYTEVKTANADTSDTIGAFKSFFSALFGVFNEE
ncbi:cell division protein FtsL [Microaceticoccus formicicus]|uniref:cell division protein FtsL n=1 Tax=Microaceticoccus formicicus TaxID=3118105 RepID=UPI003CD00983|nr:cell division protein FtsL [Peptoniphilaceae bacterium AMB_02]